MRFSSFPRMLTAVAALSVAPLSSCSTTGSLESGLQATVSRGDAAKEIFNQARAIAVHLGELNTIKSNDDENPALEYVFSDENLQVDYRFRTGGNDFFGPVIEWVGDGFASIEVRYHTQPVFNARKSDEIFGRRNFGKLRTHIYVPGHWEEYLSQLHTDVALPALERKLERYRIMSGDIPETQPAPPE